MVKGSVYVIGAGLSGLSAAVHLVGSGVHVQVFEAAPQAGGRCRSWFDEQLGEVIDNGNHLVLSGNRDTFSYLKAIGAEKHLTGPREPRFAFCDLRKATHWTISPNSGPLPWWLFSRARRVPRTRAIDYARFALLLRRNRGAKVSDIVACQGAVWENLMRPFLLAALNMPPEQASAELAGAVIRETLGRGGKYCLPRIAFPNLSSAFIDPAVAFLTNGGAEVRLGDRLRAIEFEGSFATSLQFGSGQIALSPEDRVVLAVPSWVATTLLPGITAPEQSSAIVNAHYRASAPDGTSAMLGVIGGNAEWIFSFPGRISVTVSGADDIVDRDRADLAELLWRDVATALGAPKVLPPWQIVKEKRATFRAAPDQDAKRPSQQTRWRNLFLAGDWTATGLPATIEGAVRAGRSAARLALRAR